MTSTTTSEAPGGAGARRARVVSTRRHRRAAVTARGTTIATVLCLALVVLIGAGCGGDPAPSAGGSQDAADLVSALGCSGCHSTNGDKKSGPTWQGLAGSDVRLADGRTVVADRAYLIRSIRDPGADVVDGFAPIMPDLDLDPDQIDAVVTYIQELEP